MRLFEPKPVAAEALFVSMPLTKGAALSVAPKAKQGFEEQCAAQARFSCLSLLRPSPNNC